MKLIAASCLLLILMGCKTMQKISSIPAFDSEAHRGGRGLMPENTIPAMLNALDLGVTTLEMDAVITADNQVVLSHEPFFNTDITTKPDGSYLQGDEAKALNIYTMTYEQVRQLDVGLKPNPRFPGQRKLAAIKPLLSDVIDSAESHAKATKRSLPFYNIETKLEPSTDNIFHPKPDLFVELLMNVIMKKGIQDRVIIQSFDFRSLKLIHQKYPGIKLAALVYQPTMSPGAVIDQLGFTPFIFSPEYNLVNDKVILDCHSKGMRILPWTVNTAAEISKLKKAGVDGIITDFPNLFKE
ncbi:MAG TPA: glycerophosphodiester phosphodiesterase family protein [Flavitalea sp.]|nr:glycerophosphodiester phosphodiesterase family protein [Flavitalea sp.]